MIVPAVTVDWKENAWLQCAGEGEQILWGRMAACVYMPRPGPAFSEPIGNVLAIVFRKIAAPHGLGLTIIRRRTWDWRNSVHVERTAWPELKGSGGHGLASLKMHLGLAFEHHDAGEDARTAAEVVLRAEGVQTDTPGCDKLRLEPCAFNGGDFDLIEDRTKTIQRTSVAVGNLEAAGALAESALHDRRRAET